MRPASENKKPALLISLQVSLAAGIGVGSLPVVAQGELALEEVVVTARKRDETLESAPVAIKAISGRELRDYNITKIEDMATLAGGGVIIADSGVSPTMSIRGVSSDATNAGFDQSVGLVIDGVFYDRSRWTSQGFFDTAQVEILKGPQALYFGKSTVAGALVLSTSNPTPEFEGSVTGGYEVEAEQWYGEGYVSGPVTDTLGARLALRYSDSEGWLENQAPTDPGSDFGAEEEFSGRLTLQWDPNDDLSANFKVQAVQQDTDGPATRGQLYNCRGPSPSGTSITGVPADIALSNGAFFPITDDCELNDKITVYPGPPGLGFGEPQGEFDSILTSLNIAWDVGDWTITSVTGWNDYTLKDETGYVAAQGNITADQKETNESFSQELRLLSSFSTPFNFLAGVNYQSTDFSFRNASQIILAIPDSRNGRAASQEHLATQDARSISVFGEVVWDISEQWALSAGARYSDEEKDADYDLFFVNDQFEPIFGFPFWLPEGTLIKDEFSDDNISPQITLEWTPYEGMNAFISYREGFLPGGFSLGATPQAGLQLEDFQFDSEEVEGFEIGFKTRLLDDSLSLDVIAYDYEYTDLQVNLYVPETASFVVGNAGEALTTGVEANLRWQATSYLQLSAFATYNDGEYSNYRSQCYTLQTAAQGCDPVTNTQDLDGKRLPRAPEYTFGLGSNLLYPIGDLNFNFRTDLFWSDDYQLETTNSPFLVQDSYVRVDASASLETMDGRWRVALIGRNLTDEDIGVFGATRGFTNDNLATIQRLRSWGGEVTYRF
tara:strand:- start:5695 stop:8037 length:2343 start_codon:yes stop_codon:yes gene_type:complete